MQNEPDKSGLINLSVNKVTMIHWKLYEIMILDGTLKLIYVNWCIHLELILLP